MTTYTIDPILAGPHPHVTRDVTIASGEDLTAGAVLGVITADGTYKLRDKDSADGSQVAKAVLDQDIDASNGAATALVILHGEVSETALNFATGEDIEDVRQELIAAGIYPLARK